MFEYTLREWQTIPKPKDDFIINASTPNGLDLEEKFPIGVSYKYAGQSLIGNHEKLVLCAVSVETDKKNFRNISREMVVKKMKKIGIPNQKLEPNTYFQELPNYKFIVSPAGNGTDCHRHYEAIMSGCIPIVEYNRLIPKNYGNCPILYTRDYSEITPEYLERIYNQMIDMKFDFSRLFVSSYSHELQSNIHSNSLYYKYAILKPESQYLPKWMHSRS